MALYIKGKKSVSNEHTVEDDLNFWHKWKRTSILKKMEDDLIFNKTGRRPQYLTHMEDYLNFFHQRKTGSYKQQLKLNNNLNNFINNLEDLFNKPRYFET